MLVTLQLLIFICAGAAADYQVQIDKTKRLLLVRAADDVVKVYQVALGRGGVGTKQQLGDNKTPVGNYRVMGFNPSSKFDYFIRLSYPNVKDAFYGLAAGTIDRNEFDRIVRALRAGRMPPQNTALGGAIGIHGIGEESPKKIHIHEQLDWTEGCIALRNHDVHELKRFLRVGTPVEIIE